MIQTNHIKIFTIVLTSISYLIGEHWNLLLILLVLNILDAITGTLKAKRRAKDLSKEGVSAIKDNYDKSIAETLENAKKLWGD